MTTVGVPRGAGFDALRLLAALVVVVQHGSLVFGTPGIGAAVTLVDGVGVFFVISGMLLTGSAVRAVDGRSWGRYAVNRFARIVPAIAVFVLLVPLVAVVVSPDASGDGGVLQWAWWYLGPFIGVPLASPGLFDGTDVNGHLWTIPAEVSFYVALPILVVLARRWGLRRVAVGFVLVCLAVEVGARAAGGDVQALTHHTFVERAAYFGAGMWFARGPVAGSWAWAATAFVGYLGLRWSRTLDGAELVFSELGTPVVSIVAAVLIGHVVAVVGTRATVFRDLTRRIGDLSYGTYIWHPLVILVMLTAGWSGPPALLVAVVVSSACGALSWWFVERRVLLVVRQRRTRSAAAAQRERAAAGTTT